VSVVGLAAFTLAHRLRGSSSLQMYHAMAAEPRASREQVASRQLQRLQDLVRHANDTVPYYRELFASIGLEPGDVTSLESFARIPVLTKDILRAHRDDLVSTAYPRESLLVHNSGGSTGVPVSFFRDRSYLDASDAGTYRNLSQCGWKPGDMVAFVWGFNTRLDAMRPIEFELRQRLRRFYQFDPFKSSPADLDAWVDRMRVIRPTAVHGYASTIARLARRMIETGRTVPGVRGVFTTAERLYAPQRKDMQDAFGCTVFDLYGSSEVQNIAAECPSGSMHINADFCHLEFDEASSGSGSRPLLVTSLKSRAFPFIRYRNDDAGTGGDGGSCNCGSGFPVMKLTVARESDNFTLPSGRVVHGEFFTHLMYGAKGIERFQFHQISAGEIVLRVVPGTEGVELARTTAAGAAEELRRQLGSDLHVEVALVDDIQLSAAGKHRFTRSDVRPVAESRAEAVAVS